MRRARLSLKSLYHAQRSYMYFTERTFAAHNTGCIKLSLHVSSLGDMAQVYRESTLLQEAENSSTFNGNFIHS